MNLRGRGWIAASLSRCTTGREARCLARFYRRISAAMGCRTLAAEIDGEGLPNFRADEIFGDVARRFRFL